MFGQCVRAFLVEVKVRLSPRKKCGWQPPRGICGEFLEFQKDSEGILLITHSIKILFWKIIRTPWGLHTANYMDSRRILQINV